MEGESVSPHPGLAEILEAMPDAVVAVDDTGTIRRVNSQAEHLFGYAPGELIGQPLECLVPEDVRARHAEHRLSFQARPHLRRMGDGDRHLAALRKDGTLVPVDIGLGTLPGTGGRFTLAFVRDQSRMRSLLDSLSRTREELELELELRRNYRSMSDLLQSTAPRDAVRPVLRAHLEHLLPGTTGAILLLDPRSNQKDCLVAWGGNGNSNTIDPYHCAIPQGVVVQGGDGVAQSRNVASIDCGELHLAHHCSPLIANGETIGVLELHQTEPNGTAPAMFRTADAVAERLSLPVANLRLRERLQELTYRDPLTGLHNRRYLQDALAKDLAAARRTSGTLAVALLDLDHFKRLNDTWGHGLGDDVLRSFAAQLTARFRTSDIVCRYGGEEFVVVANACSGADLSAALDSLRVEWSHLGVVTERGVEVRSTFSAGVAQFPHDGVESDALLKAADSSLYEAKRLGRNRVMCLHERRTCLAACEVGGHSRPRA